MNVRFEFGPVTVILKFRDIRIKLFSSQQLQNPGQEDVEDCVDTILVKIQSIISSTYQTDRKKTEEKLSHSPTIILCQKNNNKNSQSTYSSQVHKT